MHVKGRTGAVVAHLAHKFLKFIYRRVISLVFTAGVAIMDEAPLPWWFQVANKDPAAQAHFVIDKIEASLESLGSKLSDVVRTRVFVNNMSDWEAISRAHGERFADIRPANTMFIAKLIGDEYLVEIEAEAIIQPVAK